MERPPRPVPTNRGRDCPPCPPTPPALRGPALGLDEELHAQPSSWDGYVASLPLPHANLFASPFPSSLSHCPPRHPQLRSRPRHAPPRSRCLSPGSTVLTTPLRLLAGTHFLTPSLAHFSLLVYRLSLSHLVRLL